MIQFLTVGWKIESVNLLDQMVNLWIFTLSHIKHLTLIGCAKSTIVWYISTFVRYISRRLTTLYRYFLFLVFSQHHYLLVSLQLSRLRGTPISYPVFIPFVLWLPRCTCTPIFLTHFMHFPKARRLWEPGTRISTGILSLFCLFPKVSHANVHGAFMNHIFFSHLNPQTDTFLHDISLH